MGNRLSKIYTRTGDDGSTGLGDGTRVGKDSARVTAYGTVDEANSSIGVVLATPVPDDIRVQIESMLLDKTISYKEIADWATDSGYPISKSAIGRYAQRTGRAAMRLQYARENAHAIITAMQEHRGLELSDAANALVMDNLIQVLSDASAEDYGEIPLPKLIELVLKNQRNAVYKERMVRAYAKDVETVRRALMAELTEQVRHNPELLGQLEKASLTAAKKVVEASET